MQILIATKNPGKFREIMEVLGDLPFEFLSLQQCFGENFEDVEETGKTHDENALIKAKYFFEKSKLPTLAEDSGLHLDEFPNEFGVSTRRWHNLERASDQEWISKFLEWMKNVSEEKRGAIFKCSACFIDEKGEPHFFHGEVKGKITKILEAPIQEGIPISSCFRPEGYDKVYASLPPEIKAKTSHRGRAISKVRDLLKKFMVV